MFGRSPTLGYFFSDGKFHMETTDGKTTIHLHVDEDPFARINKAMLNDAKLSWKAKGVLSYLLGKPQGWKIWRNDLIHRSTDGRDSVDSALRELETAGYLRREQRQERNNGQFGSVVWHVSDRPMFAGLPTVAEKPLAVSSSTVNPSLTKTDNNKTECNEKAKEAAVVTAGPINASRRRVRWKNQKRPRWTRAREEAFAAKYPDEYMVVLEYGRLDDLKASGFSDGKGGWIQNPEKFLLARAEVIVTAREG